MTKVDDAVRNYLLALRDPAALKDEGAVEALKTELDRTEDPVSRIQIQQQIINAERVDASQYEDDFVAHAKAWADKHGVGAAAFQAEGVGEAVLRRAGFSLPRGRSTSRGSGQRRRVSADNVRAAIPSKGPFTVAQVQDASGASAAVVRRIVAEAVEAGKVKATGTDPNHQGPGRAPMLYDVV